MAVLAGASVQREERDVGAQTHVEHSGGEDPSPEFLRESVELRSRRWRDRDNALRFGALAERVSMAIR